MARASRPESRDVLKERARRLGSMRLRTRTRSARGRRPANPNPIAEIGGHRPEPAPRREKGECCLVSFVERFLRRPRGRWPHGTNGISPGWPDRREPRPEIDRAGSFLTQQVDLAVRGGFARAEAPAGYAHRAASVPAIHTFVCATSRVLAEGSGQIAGAYARHRARTDSFARSINRLRGDLR